ncbi:MAG: DHH family phosphoesterase [Prevotella sp.]|nr:DHH family phosphoesterase [Prevotella sp.]
MTSLNILSDQQTESLTSIIREARSIVACCHKSPDGDAIGALLGWGDFLRSQGKNPLLVAPDACPDFLRWMPGIERIVRHDRRKDFVEEALGKADLIFCLDFNSARRVLDMQTALESAKGPKVLIDHHEAPDIDACLAISFPQMSSTCELLFRIIHQLGGYDQLTRNAILPLYAGMMTDTGGFTYNANRPEIFHIIALMLEKVHFDRDKIHRNVFNNYSEWCVRMRGYVMSQKLVVIEGTHACYYALTKEEMRQYHFIRGDAEGLVNEPLRIKGMRLSISLREDTERENTIWVSLRSIDQYYCNDIAEKFFNGGGHKNAAGGRVNGSIDDAVQITHRAILFFAEKWKGG